ncbi:hypothetical protein MKW94_016515 [Papaver nudicaule]|uniref:Wax synthase domain-containing protein n=1 Tax=Papaver nudicaule TaxID=74823 RepID=A0AA41VET2_PAPNU|nr:hypothetical protein [Papaver nudicaule]
MAEFGDGEFVWFIKVYFVVYASLTYCYFICGNIPKGFPRLLSVLPIIYIFILLPLNLSSLHLSAAAGFCISWLASFKLTSRGPLSFDLPLLHFLAIGSLPINVKQSKPSSSGHMQGLYYYALEVSFVGSILCTYWYFQQCHYNPNFMVINFLYLFHLCFLLEPTLVVYSALARLLFNLDVEPPFGNCFLLSSSIHDFWGRRWNLMVSSILKSIVYKPVRRVFKKSWGVYVAILATFFVSGLMHELLFFYMSRKQPCWDVTGYYILNGICLAMEIKVKRCLNGKWQLNRLISQPVVTGFFICSTFWLLLPAFGRLRAEIVVIEEIANFTKLLKDVLVHTRVLSLECIVFAKRQQQLLGGRKSRLVEQNHS